MTADIDAHDQPPAYDDGASNDVNALVPPTIHVLAGQSIRAESAHGAPLYQLDRGIATLSYATSEVEFMRVDRLVMQDANDEPTIKPRTRHIYDIKHIKGVYGTLSSLESKSPPIFIQATSKKNSVGHLGLKKSHMRSHWKVLPVDVSGKSSKYGQPAFFKDAKPVFELRHKRGRYEWVDPEGNAIAVEDEGEDQYRFVVTATLRREVLDALVALWCCRLWQYSAEHQEPLFTGMDGGKEIIILGRASVGGCLTFHSEKEICACKGA